MRKLMVATAIVALGMGATGCATKKYVNTRVSDVNDKVSTLSQDLEKTQERTRANEQKISEVDAKADQIGQRADAAGKSASDAMNAAATTDKRVTDIDRANRRLVYEVVLQEDKARFANGKATLAPDAKTELDELISQLAANPQNYFIEIEGHTDSRGSSEMNERLGLQRAEAVKRYLYEQHNVPLHKINVISFGEERPVASNTTRAGRAQNRRVVVRVLS